MVAQGTVVGTRARYRIVLFGLLFVISSIGATVSSFIVAPSASAATSAEIKYCVDTFKQGDTIATAAGTKEEWQSHHCDDVCKTNMENMTGITKVESCNANTTPTDVAAQQSASSDKIIIDGYSSAVCGTDKKCLDAASTCVQSFLANGYDDSNAPVYPAVNIDTIADCISKNTGKSRNGVWSTLSSASASITAKATAASDASAQQSCTKDGGTWDSVLGQCNKPTNKTTCSPDIGAIGWIVCPVMTFMSSLNDQMFGFISKLLEFPGSILAQSTSTSGSTNSTYQAWQIFRNYANVAFVIVFLIIIVSQISSVGISNYGVKRMLPRLLVSAILVNVSFYLCAAAVDISNIVGAGMGAIFNQIIDQVGTKASISWSTTTANILAGTALAGAAAGAIGIGVLAAGGGIGLIALLLPILVAALLAFGMILLILVARWAIIILLIVIAPLAFVARLLPNTEDWFKRWWKMLSALLMLYPVVAIVFGASKLASAILAQLGGGWIVVALGVMAIPLFAVPGLLKGALAATGNLGAKLQGFGSQVSRGGRGLTKKQVENSRLGEATRAEHSRRTARKIERRIGNGRIGRINKAIDNSRFGRYIGGDKGAAGAVAAEQKINREAVENSVAMLEHEVPETKINKAQEQLLKANATGDVIAARAAAQVLRSAGTPGRDRLHETIRSMTTAGAKMNDSVSAAIRADGLAAGVKGYDSVMDAWNASGRDISSIESDPKSMARLNESEIAGQTLERLKDAETNKALTGAQARRVLDAHAKGTIPLDEDKRILLERVAASDSAPDISAETSPVNQTQSSTETPSATPEAPSTSAAPASTTSVTHNGQSFEQADGGLYVPRGR